MANPSKRKGTDWETDVVEFFNAAGIPARRNVQHGARDIGDIWVPNFALEAKAEKSYDLAGYVTQANAEALHAKQPFGAAVVKRPRANVSKGYVVMDLATFARVLNALIEGDNLRAFLALFDQDN